MLMSEVKAFGCFSMSGDILRLPQISLMEGTLSGNSARVQLEEKQALAPLLYMDLWLCLWDTWQSMGCSMVL